MKHWSNLVLLASLAIRAFATKHVGPGLESPRATKTRKSELETDIWVPSRRDASLSPARNLFSRDSAEHVVLANCVTEDGLLSSEMAYFAGSPDNSPTDIAIVDTSYNTTRQWVNTTTSTLFTDTNVTFTAVLGPEVGQDEQAGTGNNGYGTFVCWELTLDNLYWNDAEGTNCSGVYDCDHGAQPTVTSTALSSSAATVSQSPSMSRGAEIGIAIACVAFVALVAIVSALILIRYLAVKKGKTGGVFDLFVPKPKPAPPPPPPVGYWGVPIETLNDPARIQKIEYLGPQPGQTYEAVGSHGYEVTGDERYPPREIDGAMMPRELLASTQRQEPTPSAETDAVKPPMEQVRQGRPLQRREGS